MMKEGREGVSEEERKEEGRNGGRKEEGREKRKERII